MGFEKAVALEEILGAQLRPIGQERDPEELLLLREIDRVFEQLRAVTVTAEGVVHDEIFQQDDESAFGRADREQKIDHPDDRPIPPQDKNPAAIGLLENEAKTLELFLFVGAEILFLAKKLDEKIRADIAYNNAVKLLKL